MTYQRFKQLWNALVSDRMTRNGPVRELPIVEGEISEHTVKALVSVANGDHSDFEKINKEIENRKIDL